MTGGQDDGTARQGRIIALVIAGAGLLSIFAPDIVTALGLEPRYVVLLTLISLAAFFWALVVTWRLWQKTRK